MKKHIFYLIMLVILAYCTNPVKHAELKSGIWRGVLKIDSTNNDIEVPFNFNVVSSANDSIRVEFSNANEHIIATDVRFGNDSVFIRMPWFDSELKALIAGDTLKGQWYYYSKGNYKLPFFAYYNVKERFTGNKDNPPDVSGKWGVTLDYGDKDSTEALGLFEQKGNTITGTFLTGAGDYGSLEGSVTGSKFNLSSFDGAHAWLYTAELMNDSTMSGMFYSGKHYKYQWKAARNKKVKMQQPDSITGLKSNTEAFKFELKDMEGKPVTNSDPRFKNKVLIIQIMGTWCPGCLEETRLFAELYPAYKDRGLEIIAADFERKDDIAKARINIQRVKDVAGAEYTFLYGGKADSAYIAKAFPQLVHFYCYPTSIYIDKKGRVRKVHAGFVGKSLPEQYAEQKESFMKFIEQLLGE